MIINHWAMEDVAMYRAYQLTCNEDVRDVGRRCVEALNLFSLVKMVDGDDWITDLLPKLENKYINKDGRWYKHTDNHQTQSWYACALAHIAK